MATNTCCVLLTHEANDGFLPQHAGRPVSMGTNWTFQVVFRDTEDGDWQRHGDTERTRHQRQLGYDAILSDILRAQVQC